LPLTTKLNPMQCTYTRGTTYLELSNLPMAIGMGNVLAVVTDRKLAQPDGGTGVAFYLPDIVSATDYYPFGFAMEARRFSSDKYRYGFNGKEKDTEGMGGGGSTYDYGFRIYNAQIAKFLSVDPLTKKYPMLTTYQFASNTPIMAIDLDGLEGLIVTMHIAGGELIIYNSNCDDNLQKGLVIIKTYTHYSGTTPEQAVILSRNSGLTHMGENRKLINIDPLTTIESTTDNYESELTSFKYEKGNARTPVSNEFVANSHLLISSFDLFDAESIEPHTISSSKTIYPIGYNIPITQTTTITTTIETKVENIIRITASNYDSNVQDLASQYMAKGITVEIEIEDGHVGTTNLEQFMQNGNNGITLESYTKTEQTVTTETTIQNEFKDCKDDDEE